MAGKDRDRELRRLRALVRKRQRVADRIVEAKSALDDSYAYDALMAPDPEHWLATDEGERIGLVRAYHARAGLAVGNRSRDTLHATAHVIVENQIALDAENRRQQLASLLARGMDRHEALHELGRDVMEKVYDILKGAENESGGPSGHGDA